VVKFVDDISNVDIKPEGSELRFHDAFQPRGANVNFAQLDGDQVLVRTYERGVEDETLACGTGVTAVAILAHLVNGVEKPINLKVAGGDTLGVDFNVDGDQIDQVTLTGPAKVVYTASIELP
jgi:diaminopimelate epimerase